MSQKTVDLVSAWNTFEQQNPSAGIDDFCRYHLMLQGMNSSKPEKLSKDVPIEKIIGRAIGKLSKFSLFYTRRAFAELELNTLDDVLYLDGLARMGTVTKKELIEAYMSEYSSGIEIIKRLIGLGLIKESENKQDKRSTNISITKNGKKVLEACTPHMKALGQMMFNPLSDEEKKVLALLLSKLERIHSNAYQCAKNKTLEEIKELLPVMK